MEISINGGSPVAMLIYFERRALGGLIATRSEIAMMLVHNSTPFH
jgi:hypothetical protein